MSTAHQSQAREYVVLLVSMLNAEKELSSCLRSLGQAHGMHLGSH